ncbi:hypothetical protein ACF1A5_12265 [Streptomyces sp. NPDC014864]|uniref:hypothetical protein n=1 Tax=Streptomyces sp. NPDC014864 TaxID=3364924 RepID=UPI0036F78776
MSASAAVRSLRAAVFAAVCVLLAAAGHGLAVGDMPPLWADAGAFLSVFAVGWALGGRERSLVGIGAAMLVTQAGLHFAFGAAHRVNGSGGRMDAMHMASMNGHTMTATHAHSTADSATAAHLLAALLASWWLRRGEAALWSLLRRAAGLVPGLVAWWRGVSPPFPYGPAVRVPAGPDSLRLTLLLRHAVHRRGPPAAIPYSV